jgi:hypothetical protein
VLSCRRVRLLTVAAVRERNEPRSSLSTVGVQHRMMTFVNVTIDQWKRVFAEKTQKAPIRQISGAFSVCSRNQAA